MEGNEAKGANIKEDKMLLTPLRCLRRSSRGVCIFKERDLLGAPTLPMSLRITSVQAVEAEPGVGWYMVCL